MCYVRFDVSSTESDRPGGGPFDGLKPSKSGEGWWMGGKSTTRGVEHYCEESKHGVEACRISWPVSCDAELIEPSGRLLSVKIMCELRIVGGVMNTKWAMLLSSVSMLRAVHSS